MSSLTSLANQHWVEVAQAMVNEYESDDKWSGLASGPGQLGRITPLKFEGMSFPN